MGNRKAARHGRYSKAPRATEDRPLPPAHSPTMLRAGSVFHVPVLAKDEFMRRNYGGPWTVSGKMHGACNGDLYMTWVLWAEAQPQIAEWFARSKPKGVVFSGAGRRRGPEFPRSGIWRSMIEGPGSWRILRIWKKDPSRTETGVSATREVMDNLDNPRWQGPWGGPDSDFETLLAHSRTYNEYSFQEGLTPTTIKTQETNMLWDLKEMTMKRYCAMGLVHVLVKRESTVLGPAVLNWSLAVVPADLSRNRQPHRGESRATFTCRVEGETFAFPCNVWGSTLGLPDGDMDVARQFAGRLMARQEKAMETLVRGASASQDLGLMMEVNDRKNKE